jgi:hypothetical protein
MGLAVLNKLASENRTARAVIACGCAYEFTAMCTRLCPTLSMLCWKLGFPGKVFAGVILLMLGVHFYATPDLGGAAPGRDRSPKGGRTLGLASQVGLSVQEALLPPIATG